MDSTHETLRVIDGALGPRGQAWLADTVELWDPAHPRTWRGPAAVAARLRHLHDVFDGADREDVRLTIDAGRGVAEWVLRGVRRLGASLEDDDGVDVAVPMACAFEIEAGLVHRIRLYYDPHDLAP